MSNPFSGADITPNVFLTPQAAMVDYNDYLNPPTLGIPSMAYPAGVFSPPPATDYNADGIQNLDTTAYTPNISTTNSTTPPTLLDQLMPILIVGGIAIVGILLLPKLIGSLTSD